MRECIVHIGMHKTGSSSIQSCLENYDDGVTRYAKIGGRNHSFALKLMFSSDPLSLRGSQRRGFTDTSLKLTERKLRAAFDRELKRPNRRVIMSAESLSRMPKEAIARFRQALIEHERDAYVVGYVRDPISLSSSLFQQRVKGGGMEKLFVPRPLYKERFASFYDLFEEQSVNLIKYKPDLFPERSVVRDFLSRLSIAQDKLEVPYLNQSLSLEAVSLLLELNRFGKRPPRSNLLVKARLRLVHALRQHFTGPAFRFPKSVIGRSIDYEDIDWLEKRAGISFAEELRDYDKSWNPSQLEAIFEVHPETKVRLRALLEQHRVAHSENDSTLAMTCRLHDFFHAQVKTASQQNVAGKREDNRTFKRF